MGSGSVETNERNQGEGDRLQLCIDLPLQNLLSKWARAAGGATGPPLPEAPSAASRAFFGLSVSYELHQFALPLYQGFTASLVLGGFSAASTPRGLISLQTTGAPSKTR